MSYLLPTNSFVISNPIFGGTTKLIIDGDSLRSKTFLYDLIPAIVSSLVFIGATLYPFETRSNRILFPYFVGLLLAPTKAIRLFLSSTLKLEIFPSDIYFLEKLPSEINPTSIFIIFILSFLFTDSFFIFSFLL